MGNTLLVTGASGHLARLVLEKLIASKTGRIVATTRTPDKVAPSAAKGVQLRQASFDDPASLDAAFKGVDRMLLVSTSSVDGQGTRLRQHQTAIDAAVRAGIKHIVFTSFVKAKTSSLVLAPDYKGTEEALEKSGLGYTVLRNNLYTDYLLDSLRPAVALGQKFTAAGNGKVAYITREDCATAAAAALSSAFDGKRTLELTGPASMGMADLVRLGSELAGKKIIQVPVTPAKLVEGLTKNGVPAPMASMMASFDASIAKGEMDYVSSAFRELTKHEPQSVQGFLTAHRAELASVAAA